MRGGTQVEERRDRLGACKCARQGSHLGPLRPGSSAQGPGWGREGGVEGERAAALPAGARGASFVAGAGAGGSPQYSSGQPTARPGRGGQRSWVIALLFYSKPPRLPLGGPFPAPTAISQAQRDDFRFLEGVC